MKNRRAFTLAEVLITLGIIGVVAAMTIPTLLANIKGAQYRAKFKKVISTLSNAARMSQEQYGFDFAGIDTKCNADNSLNNPETQHSICSLLNGTLQGTTYYSGIDKLNNYNPKSYNFENADSFKNYRNRNPVYQLQDGSLIIFSAYLSVASTGNFRTCTRAIGSAAGVIGAGEEGAGMGNGCYAMVDVNGTSGPNKEVECTKGENKYMNVTDAGDCIVEKKDVTDIYPVLIYDGIAQPKSRAAWYVFNSTK